MLTGRWALITGASAGIGWATAEALAGQGCSVILTGRRLERLQELAQQIQTKFKVEAIAVVLDVTQTSHVEHFAAQWASDLKRVSILINNAGLALGTDPLPEGKIADWETMVQTNVLGLLRITRVLLPSLQQQPQGHVVNIGSVAGHWVYPGGGVYCATKFAVRALSEGLRMDLMGSRVRVTNIEPGMVETEFSQVRLNDETKAKKVYEGMTPLKAEDVADTIVWCLNRPAHVTVSEIKVFPTDQAAVGLVHRKSFLKGDLNNAIPN